VVVDIGEGGASRIATENREEDTGQASSTAAGTTFIESRSGTDGADVEEKPRRTGQERSREDPGVPPERPRRGRRRSRGIFSRRRGASRRRPRRTGKEPAPGAQRDARRDGDDEGAQRNGFGEQGSLIPGVWEGVREEEPEPREPTPEEVVEQFRVRDPEQERAQKEPVRRRRGKRLARGGGRFASTIVRGLAALALIAALLVPPYLWWSTRYYMTYDNEEIVVHQGVPYDFLGNELNRVDRRTGVMESDIAEPYRDQIRDNRLYTEDRLQTVLEDLQEA
ncbi:MAG: hypothetical protein L0G70_09630, partial [Rubrobacter sp.]|nr:hypothetical protein [Rubrobacter sp.]